jgi:hypothetical protein
LIQYAPQQPQTPFDRISGGFSNSSPKYFVTGLKNISENWWRPFARIATQRSEVRREYLKKARKANLRELQERAAQHVPTAAHLNQCRFEAADATCIASDESTPIPAISLGRDAEAPRPDCNFEDEPNLATVSHEELFRLTLILKSRETTLDRLTTR